MPTLVTECYYMGYDGHGRGLKVKQSYLEYVEYFEYLEKRQFRNFFDVFSKSFLKRVSKRQKIGPSRPKTRRRQKFGAGFRWSPSWWGEIIERGKHEIFRITCG